MHCCCPLVVYRVLRLVNCLIQRNGNVAECNRGVHVLATGPLIPPGRPAPTNIFGRKKLSSNYRKDSPPAPVTMRVWCSRQDLTVLRF